MKNLKFNDTNRRSETNKCYRIRTICLDAEGDSEGVVLLLKEVRE